MIEYETRKYHFGAIVNLLKLGSLNVTVKCKGEIKNMLNQNCWTI